MRLITWNPQAAFRNKASVILKYNPDILIAPESEHPDKVIDKNPSLQDVNTFWYGDTPHKGICLYAFGGYRLELLPEFEPMFRYVLPFRVTGGRHTFILLAVWAMHNKENYAARYIGQLWGALQHYAQLLNEPIIIAGDFNSNKIWDQKKRVGNHTDVVRMLSEHNIRSVYHTYFNEDQGQESRPTFYLQRKQHKPYHIDYCFASESFTARLKCVAVGSYGDWCGYSDHVPVIVEFGE